MRTEQICEIDFAVKWVDIVAVLVDLVIADGHDNVTDLHSGFHRGRVRLDIRDVDAARFACLTGVFSQLLIARWKKLNTGRGKSAVLLATGLRQKLGDYP